MFRSFGLLDRILRGELTRPSHLTDGRLTFPVGGVSIVVVILAMLYGACMGAYSIFRTFENLERPETYLQLLASTLKTPALFLLTLLITFPSLYVFNALVGSRLNFLSVLRLLVAAVGVNLAVLASLGPIVAFFSLSTNSYGFMVLLNVTVFAIAGILGLSFLVRTLNRLQHAQLQAEAQSPTPELELNAPPAGPSPEVDEKVRAPFPPSRPGAIDRIPGQATAQNVRAVFAIWIVVFSLVGAQMGWILRPFIGAPSEPFTWLRPRDSNFFEAVSEVFVRTVLGIDPRRDRSTDSYGSREAPAAPTGDDGGGNSVRRAP
jgi:hypothetical protein